MPRTTEREEEIYARRVLSERFGARLRKLPESECPGVKTPDYEVLDEVSRRVALLEVKRFERTPRTAENGRDVTISGDGLHHVSRRDNGPQRVGQMIHEAGKQLLKFSKPKILVFVNEEALLDVLDLEEAFNGFLFYSNEAFGYYNTASLKIAAGRIQQEKREIDLYVWIDRLKGSDPAFRFTTTRGQDLGRRFFGYAG